MRWTNTGYNGTDESSGFSKSRYCRALTIFALFLYRIVTREGKRGLLLCLRIRRLNCFVVGVHTIAYAYPKVKIVTAAVDPEVNDKYHVIPGIGELHLLTKLLILPTVHTFSNKTVSRVQIIINLRVC